MCETFGRASMLTIRDAPSRISRPSARKFIVPIYPTYHTELLPDSILNTETAEDFEDNKSNRNALSKVYIRDHMSVA